jgi:hypothetical protein
LVILVFTKGNDEGLELDGTSEGNIHETAKPDDDSVFEDDDGPWYIGKAKEQFHSRRWGHGNVKVREEEDDPIQVSRPSPKGHFFLRSLYFSGPVTTDMQSKSETVSLGLRAILKVR